MKILVAIKNVYGNETIYPRCEKSELFCTMVGTKTLTSKMIATIKKLGYAIEVEQKTL